MQSFFIIITVLFIYFPSKGTLGALFKSLWKIHTLITVSHLHFIFSFTNILFSLSWLRKLPYYFHTQLCNYLQLPYAGLLKQMEMNKSIQTGVSVYTHLKSYKLCDVQMTLLATTSTETSCFSSLRFECLFMQCTTSNKVIFIKGKIHMGCYF